MKRKLSANMGFDELYKKYRNLLFKIALLYLGNDYHGAEEAVQNAFLQLYIYYKDIDHTYIKAWLVATTRNYTLNQLKKRSHEILRGSNIVEIEEGDGSISEESCESAEEEFWLRESNKAKTEFKNELFTKLYAVNPRWYKAIVSSYCLGRPQRDIAREMGISINALHGILFRAKRWIQKNYGDRFNNIN